ncbi:MAG: serine hydrolase, partial [Candidatus Korarchaeota archaeon]|nr:serine hydrolase [Candidatus Korarchaeota archaeon]
PGARCVYSDIGYIVATAVVERASDTRLDGLFEELVARPLGLRRTMYNPLSRGYEGRIAATERVAWRGGVIRGVVHDENAYAMDGVSGHAGLFSTAEEVGRIAWSVAESLGGSGLFSEPMARAMTSLWSEGSCTYGLGWRLYRRGYRHAGDLFSPRAFGHTGFTGTSVWVDPEYEAVIVMLTNRVHLGRDAPIAEARARIHNAVMASLGRQGSRG